MELIIAGVLMCVIGFIIGRFSYKPKHYGTIRVDTSDPDDAPYLFLELHHDKSVNNIIHEQYVTFKVDVKNYITQK